MIPLTPRISYHRIDPDLVLPSVRAQIERDCTAIAEGKQTFADVVQRSLAVFRAKFSHFVASIALMDELFEASFTQMQSSQSRPLSRCGRCRRYMQFISIKPQRMYGARASRSEIFVTIQTCTAPRARTRGRCRRAC